MYIKYVVSYLSVYLNLFITLFEFKFIPFSYFKIATKVNKDLILFLKKSVLGL